MRSQQAVCVRRCLALFFFSVTVCLLLPRDFPFGRWHRFISNISVSLSFDLQSPWFQLIFGSSLIKVVNINFRNVRIYIVDDRVAKLLVALTGFPNGNLRQVLIILSQQATLLHEAWKVARVPCDKVARATICIHTDRDYYVLLVTFAEQFNYCMRNFLVLKIVSDGIMDEFDLRLWGLR